MVLRRRRHRLPAEALTRSTPPDQISSPVLMVEFGFGKRRGTDHFACGEETCGPQYPFHLGQDGDGVGNVHEKCVTVSGIERIVFKGKSGHVARPEDRVAVPSGCSGCPGYLDL